MIHKQGYFTGKNDLPLFYQFWFPTSQKNQPLNGIVIFLHGFSEHSGRYMNLVNELIPHDFALYGMDMQGTGKSEGKRWHIKNFYDYLNDLHKYIEMINFKHPELPLFIFAHSMGAVVACSYLLTYKQMHKKIKGVILNGPAFSLKSIDSFLLILAKILAFFWPSFRLDSGLPVQNISRDPEILKNLNKDPLICRSATARFAVELTRTMKNTMKRFNQFKFPLLILHGEMDKIVMPEISKNIYEKVKSADKNRIVYKNGFHEVINDLDYKKALTDITNWLKKHI